MQHLEQSERHPSRRRPARRTWAVAAAAAVVLVPAGAASAATSPTPPPPPVPVAAVIASGDATHLVDALSAGPLAASLHTGLLLTSADQLSKATADQLTARGVTTVYVVGGPTAVSQHVLDQIDAAVSGPVVRVSGADRYATAVAATRYAEGFVEAPLD